MPIFIKSENVRVKTNNDIDIDIDIDLLFAKLSCMVILNVRRGNGGLKKPLFKSYNAVYMRPVF